MKKIFMLALIVSLPLFACSESLPSAGSVVPTNDLTVRCGTATDLGWAKPNQQYYCLGRTKAGYSVLAQADGKPEVGFIPLRDEWGHITAITWEHVPALRENMLLIRTPLKIEPGCIVLEKAKQYPIVAAEKDTFAVRYGKDGFCATVTVSRAEVNFVAVDTVAAPLAQNSENTRAATQDLQAVRTEAAKPIETQPESDWKEAAKAEEKKTSAARPEAAMEISKIKHAAVGAKVTVSSTHAGETGEGPAEALVDGDLQTRWSSEYSEPQEVVVELDKEQKLGKLRLYWEVAAAVNYNAFVSADGREWIKTQSMTDGKIGPRVDELDMKNTPAKFIKLELLNRIHDTWGFSLYEIEVVGQE
jgi:hypothetical protein